ncbi:MAG: hypothetical protein HC896_16870 [Bacteroidales bacterium]|nr:hypothetical protein [Bacteroidales bacterium]
MNTEIASRAYFDAATNAAIGEFVGFLKPDEFMGIANKLIQLLKDKKINNRSTTLNT